MSRGLAQLIGVSTACGLATAPVTWFQFHQISLVTVPANVVAVPVVVEVLGLALLTAVVAPFAPSVAAAMAQLNGWGAWFVAGVRARVREPPRRADHVRLARPPSSAWARSGPPPMLGSVASERELKPVYLFTGSDRPKIALALQRLRGRIGEDATEQLHAAEASGEDAVAACNALGLFGGGGARSWSSTASRAWKAADVKELEAYLAAPAPTTVLALVGDGIKKDAALAKAVAKAGEVLAYDVREEAAAGVGRRAVRAARRVRRPRRVPCARRGGRGRRRRSLLRDPEARDVGERRADHARDRRGARRRAGRDADLRRHRLLGKPRRRRHAARDRVAARPLAPAALGRADPARRLARRARRPRPEDRRASPTRASARARSRAG